MRKGVLLGIANVCVVAICLAIAEKDPEIVFPVGFYGMVPGLIVGAFCGALATAFPKAHVVLRLALIMLPAAALVFVLGTMFGMNRYIAIANIPTLAACLVLERWTRIVREDVDVEKVPEARVA